MDWLTFFTKITEALAWPLTVLVIAFIFRKQVLNLIPSLKELTLPGGVAARFEGKLETLEIVATSAPPSETTEATTPVSANLDAQFSVAESSIPSVATDPVAAEYNPNGVVMEAWKDLESKIRMILVASRVCTILTTPDTPEELIRALRRHKLASPTALATLEGLLKLRNEVAHSKGEVVPKESAIKYVNLVGFAIAALQVSADNRELNK